jgi:hypothetical protein
MCLQDIRLGKSWQPRANIVTIDTSQTTISVAVAANRRRISFSLPPNVDPLGAVSVPIRWMGDGAGVLLGVLNPTIQHLLFEIERYGTFIYGPFNLSESGGVVTAIHVAELLANTDEELVE